MKIACKALSVLLSLLVVVGSSSLVSAEVIWSDNFNGINGQTLNDAPLAGRLSGLEAGNIVPKEHRPTPAGLELKFTSSQLEMVGSGRVRFFSAADPAIRWDFAQGAGGAALTSPQSAGMRVEFDLNPNNLNEALWVGIALGFDAAVNPTPNFSLVAQTYTDFGLILRNNGGVQYFNNNVAGSGQSFTSVVNSPKHVTIDFLFANPSDRSFADGKQLLVTASIGDETVLSNHLVTLSGNNGKLQFEIDSSGSPSGRIDNLTISSIAIPEPSALASLGMLGLLQLIRRRNRGRAVVG